MLWFVIVELRSGRFTSLHQGKPVMLRFAIIISLVLTTSWAQPAAGQQQKGAKAYPPKLEGSQVETYKTVGDTKLNLWIYYPPGHKPGDKRSAIVFFFGGGWTGGSPQQFEQHCKHLASLGMVAITADYRVASRQQVKAVSCVADAKSAIRFVRKEAGRLGIDPNRIVAAGVSAGGHIAACTAVIKEFDESTEDTSISSVPNALALFNPAVVLAAIEGLNNVNQERVDSLGDLRIRDSRASAHQPHLLAIGDEHEQRMTQAVLPQDARRFETCRYSETIVDRAWRLGHGVVMRHEGDGVATLAFQHRYHVDDRRRDAVVRVDGIRLLDAHREASLLELLDDVSTGARSRAGADGPAANRACQHLDVRARAGDVDLGLSAAARGAGHRDGNQRNRTEGERSDRSHAALSRATCRPRKTRAGRCRACRRHSRSQNS